MTVAGESPGLSIFGIAFDSPLTIEECPTRRKGLFGKERVYGDFEYSIRQPCFTRTRERIASSEPLHSETATIHFPPKQRPAISSRNQIWVRMVDNRVQRLTFSTPGWETQNSDYAALQEKFGEPSQTSLPAFQNKLGARIEAVDAVWMLHHGVVVNYQSVARDSLDRGSVVIATPEGEEDYQAAMEQYANQRARL